MKTPRKLRTRRLALDMTTPLNPVSYERGKEGFRKLKEHIQNTRP